MMERLARLADERAKWVVVLGLVLFGAAGALGAGSSAAAGSVRRR